MLIALTPTPRMLICGIKVDRISFEETLCELCACVWKEPGIFTAEARRTPREIGGEKN